MQLLIEVGNTYAKVARYEEQQIKLSGKYPCERLEMALTPYLNDPSLEQVLFASVGPVNVEHTLLQVCQQANIPCVQIKTEAQAFGVTNGYQEFQYLGVDRWLTLVAAHQIRKEPTVIIDIGTAITVDLLDEYGCHLGGWIAPGYKMMVSSVLDNTAKVFGDVWHQDEIGFATNTADGLKDGCRAALVGMLQYAIQTAQAQFKKTQPRVLLCGGGHRHVPAGALQDIEYRRELVLEGLALYAKEALLSHACSEIEQTR